jgi:hypothetical protein
VNTFPLSVRICSGTPRRPSASASAWHTGRAVARTTTFAQTTNRSTPPDPAAKARRWSRFAADARQAGFAAVQAAAMRLRDQVIGALNLFRGTPGSFDPANVRAARARYASERRPPTSNCMPR